MSGLVIGAISIGLIFLLVYLGVYVAIALGAVSFAGVWMITGNFNLAGNLLYIAAFESLKSYEFAVVPLFVFMGLIVSAAEFGRDAFQLAARLLRRLPGGLGIATVVSNAIFAAVSGTSIAAGAVFTRIAVPEMLRLGYRPRFAVGVVAGSSVLGMLIPPSLLLIIYGITTEQSIGKLFLAGIGPGLLLAGLYCLGIVAMALFWRGFVGEPQTDDDAPDYSLTRALSAVAPLGALAALMLGGIYGGIFTPTEAGAVAAWGALVIAGVNRRITLRQIWRVLVETGYVTVTILFLVVAASMYSRMLTFAGVQGSVSSLLLGSDMTPLVFVTVYVLVLLLLGMILDATSIILICVPIVLVPAIAMGFDPIHLGIITIIAVETGLLTPPLGLSAFVVKGALAEQDISLKVIFQGCAPFVVMMLVAVALVYAFPGIAMFAVK
ncbi:TRAP transporter large permease [Mesobacterium pallidum]|uniref:TRAP transporter large permease n=1 Tax=Mesobacterium pallidum TaxID=2872037 RepID=UPI001EE33902|nr:TRAP transporter large permease [Mesobacterium pallidum]